MLEEGQTLFAYIFKDYWKDVGTIESYWQANMELIATVPEFNLYEDFWKIYTNLEHQPPQYTGPDAEIHTSLISEGCEIYGNVFNSVIGPEVIIEQGAEVRDSIIMSHTTIGKGTKIYRSIIDENCSVGDNVVIGDGENIPNECKPQIYDTGITVIGEYTQIPSEVWIGKNCVLYGKTDCKDYINNRLESGGSIIMKTEEVGR
jgi:glucose-1-phosphate adenylyltransferase